MVNGKPDPEVFLKGADGLDLKPAECLVFEDSIAGVQAAKAGGFNCVGIGSAELLKADVHFQALGSSTPEALVAQF